MKARKFLRLKARFAQASEVVVEAAKELSVVVEKAVPVAKPKGRVKRGVVA